MHYHLLDGVDANGPYPWHAKHRNNDLMNR